MNPHIRLIRDIGPAECLSDDSLYIQEGLIQIYPITNLEVQKLESVKLNPFDLFVLRASIELKVISPKDLEVIGSFPIQSSKVCLSRLESFGLLKKTIGDGYRPDTRNAEKALEEGTTFKEVSCTQSFLWFPTVRELHAITISVKQLSKLESSFSIPLPKEKIGTDLRTLVEGFVHRKELKGLDYQLSRVSDERNDLLVESSCPCYRFSGTINKEATLHITLEPTVKDEKANSRNRQSISVSLRDCNQFQEKWDLRHKIAHMLKQQDTWRSLDLQGAPPSKVNRDQNLLEALVSSSCFKKLAETKLLTEIHGLLVEFDQIRISMGLKLLPSDSVDAQTAFLVDAIISKYRINPSEITSSTIEEVVLATRQSYESVDLSKARVPREKTLISRAWGIGEYQLVYALREGRDFNYA